MKSNTLSSLFSVRIVPILMIGTMLASCNKDEEITGGGESDRVPFEGVKVYEWTPAPGQFINDNSALGGMGTDITTPEAACAWAEKRINAGLFVSLGAFGGYIVMGLDHSIVPSGKGDYDFYISGNAYLSTNGGSNEPGIVWVMADENGNYLPDDQWYELAGSDEVTRNFSVTYSRPEEPGKDTPWRASDGTSGVVKYLKALHKQDYYYPAWVSEDSYTLTGSLLAARNSEDPATGFWNNAAYAWGYADNMGSDNLSPEGSADKTQRVGFKISNAVKPDGTKANLKSIDFVKVQTGVQATSGALGEVSTEVCGFGECGGI